MLRNFLRQSRPWTKNVSPTLGRWNRGDNIDRKVDLANIDNCGDRVCGDLLPDVKPYIEVFDKRWTKEISPKEFNEQLSKIKNNNYENIDSHNNTLYHPSLKTNYNYSIQMIVDDYNKRWNAKLTVEEYLNNFTRKHRGAC